MRRLFTLEYSLPNLVMPRTMTDKRDLYDHVANRLTVAFRERGFVAETETESSSV